MKSFKTFLKIFIGIGVLVLVIIIFSFTIRSTDLETGNLAEWKKAPLERRMAATQVIIASDENLDLLVACVDKIATLPDSTEMTVRDAISLCDTGVKLKAHL